MYAAGTFFINKNGEYLKLIFITLALISSSLNAETYKYAYNLPQVNTNKNPLCTENQLKRIYDDPRSAAEAAAQYCYDGLEYNWSTRYESVVLKYERLSYVCEGYYNRCDTNIPSYQSVWKLFGTITATLKTGEVEIYPTDSLVIIWQRLAPIEKNYTIKLSTITAQPYGDYLTAIEPDGITRSNVPQNLINQVKLVAEVKDQDGNPVNAAIKLKVTALEGSGGHVQTYHTERNPSQAGKLKVGTLNSDSINIPKSGMVDGLVEFEYAASDISGDHKIEASCTDITCKQIGKDSVWVGIQNLHILPTIGDYNLVGGSCHHGGNHYATVRVIQKVQSIARAYNNLYPNDPILHLNDISLERGGLFDARSQKRHCAPLVKADWTATHLLHRTGEDVDVKANNTVGAIPAANYEDFEMEAKLKGCHAGRHRWKTAARHFHLYCTQKQGK